MGVYVKDMEMPKKCGTCNFRINDFTCLASSGALLKVLYKRPDWCPLVEVKEPHGRFIDVDELIEELKHDVAIDQDSLDYEELTEINRRMTQDDKDIKQNAIDLLEHTRCVIEGEGGD